MNCFHYTHVVAMSPVMMNVGMYDLDLVLSRSQLFPDISVEYISQCWCEVVLRVYTFSIGQVWMLLVQPQMVQAYASRLSNCLVKLSDTCCGQVTVSLCLCPQLKPGIYHMWLSITNTSNGMRHV